MSQTAKLFTNGRSQAVRLPAAYRFDGKEVFIRRNPATGDVILSGKPPTWDGFFAALEKTDMPSDFLDGKERETGPQARDPVLVTSDRAFSGIPALLVEDWTA